MAGHPGNLFPEVDRQLAPGDLRLEEASLRDPERIDVMARKLGLQSPQPGQVMHLDVNADTSASVMASVTPISVVSVR